MSRNKELVKNTLILAIGQFVPKLISIITLPILTKFLSTSEYGKYDLVNTLVSLLLPFVSLQLQQALFRYLVTTDKKDDRCKYITNSLLFILGSTLIFSPLILIGLSLFIVELKVSILVCIFLLAGNIYNLIGQILRGMGMNLQYSFSVVVYSVTNAIFIILLIVIFNMGFTGVILSMVLASAFSSLYMIVVARLPWYISMSSVSKDTIKQLLLFSIPIVPSSICLWVVDLSDRLIVTKFLGVEMNGIYSVANKIPSLYSMAYSTFYLAWTEIASRASEDKDMCRYYSELFNYLYKFLIGSMLILIAVTPIMFNLLINKEYAMAYFQMPILFLGVFSNSIVSFYAGIYIALKRTKQVGYSSVCGAIINLVLNLLLVNVMGLYAASLSTAISFFVIALYRAIDLNKVIKIQYNQGTLFIGSSLLLVSVVMCYLNSLIAQIVCIVIAILYNIIFNKDLMIQTFNIIKRKIRVNRWNYDG